MTFLKLKIYFLFLGISSLGYGLVGDDEEDHELGYVPESWYQLPEERTGRSFSSFARLSNDVDDPDESSNKGGFTNSMENILYSHGKALDKIDKTSGKKWYLDNIRTALAIGGKGLVGIMSMKGSASVRLSWRKKEQKQVVKEPENEPLERNYDVAFTSNMGREEIAQTLEPAINHAVSSGRIRDVEKFKTNLTKAAEDFHYIVSGVRDDPTRVNWFVRGFLLELYITASGDITPFINIGTEVRLRFFWYRIKRKQPESVSLVKPNSSNLLSHTKSNVTRFLSNMAEDLDIASHERLEQTGFYMKRFRVGLGVGVKGSIFAAKVKSQVCFFALFERPRDSIPSRGFHSFNGSGEEYMHIASAPNEKEINFAKYNRIPYEQQNGGSSLIGSGSKSGTSVIYKIKRKYFRKGLSKAYKMTHFFAKKVADNPREKWEVYNIEAHFELSLTGIFGISRLTGIAAARIQFSNEYN